MHRLSKKARQFAVAVSSVFFSVGSLQAATAVVDFESNPVTPTGPSIYVAVPGPQTIVTPQATFSGGVVLGFATFFPAISFATAPNVYGTADFGNRLSRSLTIDINPSFATTELGFALFNGEVFAQSYDVDAFNGATPVYHKTIANVASNFNSGYALVDVLVPTGFTRVSITATGTPSVWDFLIDTLAFNQALTSVIPTPQPIDPITNPVYVAPPQDPAPPVQGHRHGNRKGETELLEVNFGDDVNDIRGSTLQAIFVPEPALLGALPAVMLMARRRR